MNDTPNSPPEHPYRDAPPMPPKFMLHVAGATDVGLVREHNEDAYVVVNLAEKKREGVEAEQAITIAHPGTGAGALLLVCDGMGGAAAGEVASQMAIDSVGARLIDPPEPVEPAAAESSEPADAPTAIVRFARQMREAAVAANTQIFEASKADHARAGMGTTMTAVGVIDGYLVIAQVGDSRAYVLRGDRLVQVTRDQSLVNQLLESGQITEEQAALFEHSNVILQALGVQEEVEVQLSKVALRRGDRIIVCSDGLTGVITDAELQSIAAAETDLAACCRKLVEAARAGGGPDNITVVAARADGDALPIAESSDAITYARWRLDEPETPPPSATPSGADAHPPFSGPSSDGEGTLTPTITATLPSEQLSQSEVFWSWFSLGALALCGFMAASLLHRRAPSGACAISTNQAGLTIRVDGRDIGARTHSGATSVRLPLGHHRLTLRGPGAPNYEQTVDVADDAVCAVSFVDPAKPSGDAR